MTKFTKSYIHESNNKQNKQKFYSDEKWFIPDINNAREVQKCILTVFSYQLP